MKYMVLMTRESWEDTMNDTEKGKIFGEKIRPWFGKLFASGKLIEGHQLQPPDTATTVVVTDGRVERHAGPYADTVSPVGGYGVLDVADLDEAVSIVKTFPAPHTKLEIRPILESAS